MAKSVSLLWKGDGEGGAFAGRAFDCDGAAMKLHHLVYVVEPDAKTFNIVYVARGYTIEALEDMLLILFAYTQSVVGDGEDGVGAFGACRHLNVNLFG